MSQKKVLLVLNTLTLGGAEAQAVMMARIIRADTEYNPIIVGLVRGGELEKTLEQEGLEYYIYDFNFSLFNSGIWQKSKEIIKIIGFLKKLKPAIVISSTYYPNLIINLACGFIPKTKNLWYQVGKEWSLPVSRVQKLSQYFTKGFLANSNDVKGYLINRLNVRSEKIKVIPNVIFKRKKENSSSYWLEKLGLSDSEFVIILVSNFFAVKDQATAIKAIAVISQIYPQVRLVLAGYPPDPHFLNAIKALAFDLFLQEKVKFIESTSDVFGLLAIAHVGLFTSIKRHTEGSPTVIQEYMYAGLPVVASAIDCNKELFEGLDMDALYEPENEADLAKKLSRYIQDPELRRQVSKMNKQKADLFFQEDFLRKHLLEIL